MQAWFRYIYLLWQQTYLHKDSLTKLNTARNIFIYQHVWQARISNYVRPVLNECASAYVPPQLENKSANSTVDLLLWFLQAFVCADVPPKHENKWHINTESNARQKHHFSCLVVSSLPTWGAWSYHGVTAVSGRPSYWLVLCRSVTTWSPHDVLGPGERATTQTKTQTSCRSLFCTYVHRGQAAGHEWLKFISGCIHYTVKGLQLGLGNCGASMWLWQDGLTAQKWLS